MNLESQTELLKNILENLRTPDRLNDHPWTKSLFFLAHLAKNKNGEPISPGVALAAATGNLFLEMMPAAPPKRGKRLDTRWGEFGLLAAHYFVPFLFGLPYPVSLRDSWGKIDRAILLCQFGEKTDSSTDAELDRYRLVGDEPDVAPMSTISDWHVKGIEKLASLIQDREQHLSFSQPGESAVSSTDSDLPESKPADDKKNILRRLWRWISWVVITAFLVGLIFAAGKIWSIYQLAQIVRDDAEQLQGLVSSPLSLEKIMSAGASLSSFRRDLDLLRMEAEPALRLVGPWLKNVPDYGPDLAASADLLMFASQTAVTLDVSYQAAMPLMDALKPDSAKLKPQQLTRLLVDSQPQLLQARKELDSTLALRAELRSKEISPRVQALFDRLDPMLLLLDDGLRVGIALPELLGAGRDGPKTYMILVQNEDEIRPTGGFITSVGNFVVKNGNMFGLQFEDSGDLDDWTLPYPDSPWQLAQYMSSPVLVLRDANWFTDYPTSVDWVEYLYAYSHNHSVDGVIAFDQQMLVALLRVIGPLEIEGIAIPITSENVVKYMRESKVRPPNAPADWYRKAFISQIAGAVTAVLLSGDELDWKGLAEMVVRSVHERHLMLQFDDAQISELLAKYDLDGAVRPGTGDFLMSVDSNIGFNKTNAVVSSRLSYDVDLTDLAKPTGKLVISHTNDSDSTLSCIHLDRSRDSEGDYPVHLCYWNYLRVYFPEANILNSASPHAVPADWMLQQQSVPARVDPLDEIIPGVHGYGTLVVVPGGETYNTGFDFTLPSQVVSIDPISKVRAYTLKIKKQPGTLGVPATIRLHLPPSAQVMDAPSGAVVDGRNVLMEIPLVTDVIITVSFKVP